MNNQIHSATERRVVSRSQAIDWATKVWIALFGGGLVCLLAHMLR